MPGYFSIFPGTLKIYEREEKQVSPEEIEHSLSLPTSRQKTPITSCYCCCFGSGKMAVLVGGNFPR